MAGYCSGSSSSRSDGSSGSYFAGRSLLCTRQSPTCHSLTSLTDGVLAAAVAPASVSLVELSGRVARVLGLLAASSRCRVQAQEGDGERERKRGEGGTLFPSSWDSTREGEREGVDSEDWDPGSCVCM